MYIRQTLNLITVRTLDSKNPVSVMVVISPLVLVRSTKEIVLLESSLPGRKVSTNLLRIWYPKHRSRLWVNYSWDAQFRNEGT